MKEFSTKQGFLFYSFPLCEEERAKIDGMMALLDESGVHELIQEGWKESHLGRRSYDPVRLFAAVLMGFALGASSLREIESSCRNDLRFLYILDGAIPDHTTFSRFINEAVLPRCIDIFSRITEAIFRACGLEMDDCFIDGTKLEADANRYKFVWKPTRWHERTDEKARSLLLAMGLGNDMPSNGLLPSSFVAKKVDEARAFPWGGRDWQKKTESLVGYLLKIIEYEEKERICGPYRNSYYKTDHDATAMCLKDDYYSGLGSSMHAAYSVQLVVSHGLVVSYLVNQERSDMYSFIPALDAFHGMYGIYPKRICADAGYGCTENWRYCKEHGIRGFIKYNSWHGEASGRYPASYELEDGLAITCLGGRTGHACCIPGRHPKRKGAEFYIVEGCDGCAFMPYCRRFMKEPSGSFKIFEVPVEYTSLKQEARDLLLSVEGIEMRVNRSCQAEGAFAGLKHCMAYTRLRRTSLPKAALEVMLTCLGFNIRKYSRFLLGKARFSQWNAPDGIQPETFKKPSAKRLANRVQRKKMKSTNETAKNSYKYKKVRKREHCMP